MGMTTASDLFLKTAPGNGYASVDKGGSRPSTDAADS